MAGVARNTHATAQFGPKLGSLVEKLIALREEIDATLLVSVKV